MELTVHLLYNIKRYISEHISLLYIPLCHDRTTTPTPLFTRNRKIPLTHSRKLLFSNGYNTRIVRHNSRNEKNYYFNGKIAENANGSVDF